VAHVTQPELTMYHQGAECEAPLRLKILRGPRRFHYSANSFSNSFRCFSINSTSKADTDGRPPWCNARLKATRFNSDQSSRGRLIPVVWCVRWGGVGADFAFDRFSMSGLSLAQFTIDNSGLAAHLGLLTAIMRDHER
jgi:hypothetical protein